jgi:hypothetical protein
LFDGKQHTYIIGVSDIYEKIALGTIFEHFFKNFRNVRKNRFISTFSKKLMWNLKVPMWVSIQVHQHIFDILLPCTSA